MEGIEMAAPSNDDFCSSVLAQFGNSDDEHCHHICAAIGAISQELKDQSFPLTPIAYFGATCSSIDRLSSSTDVPGHLLDALVTILSLVIDRLSPAVFKTKGVYLSDLLSRVFSLKSMGLNGLVSGLKCTSRLLTVTDKFVWEDASRLYVIVMNYITDHRAKVRKQSHLSLQDILKYFQSVQVLAPLHAQASDSLTKTFERFLLLAGGSNTNLSEGPKAAQEVLYILDALRKCLPYITSKSLTNLLKYYKSLLELRHPIVTKRITDGLNSLCLHSSGEISEELLLDLLCSLAISISSNETSADSMILTIRLLDIGMKRVYSLNRQICVVKLPVIFNALKDVLASEHEGALITTIATFKSLIHSCIDENLIKQGVEQITASGDVTRRSALTIIEKVCATIESLLNYHYEAVWDMSLQIVSTMFDKLGKYSLHLMKGMLKSLAEMQKLPEEDFAFRKQLHECVGVALVALGPEAFLSLLPLNLEVEDLSESNLWLFPILKQYTVGANLKFFTKSILPMVDKMKRKSTKLEQEGKLHSARSVDGIVYSLWSLLPSFCNYPVDTAESLKDMERAICTALKEEPDVCGIICSSLQILIQQNKKIVEGKENSSSPKPRILEECAIALYTAEIAASNLRALKSSARELFSVLTGIYFNSSKDTGGLLQSTIHELASISDKEVVTLFFKKTMQKLLKLTQEAGKLNSSKNSNFMQIDNSSNDGSLSTVRARLLDIAACFLPGLNSKEIDLLFVAIQPALKDADGLIQKRAYRVLSLIFQHSDVFISRRLDEMRNLMIEVLPLCHFSAKRHRLDCLYFLIIHVSKDGSEQRRRDITTSFLTEIVLAIKEANKKTRNRAYEILVQIGRACGDENGDKDKLNLFFNMVAGGLAGETPHMISAAMTGMARLAYEFSDLVSAAYNVLPFTFLLLHRKNKEIIKATLGLLKVLVAKSPVDGLQTHLRSMVEGLLNWQDGTRNHFKAKVKLLLEMLVKKCGVDAVKEVMPEEHMKLLTNIRKLKERKERKEATKSSDDRSILSKATTSRISQWNHTRIFSDFDDEETRDSDGDLATERSISVQQRKCSSASRSKASLLRSKRAGKSLHEDSFDQLDDEPLDLLDHQQTRLALRSSQQAKRKADSDDEAEIDSDGRLIIREDVKSRKSKADQVASDIDAMARSEVGSSRKSMKKRMKTSESGWAYTGKEYVSKKAGGDLKRKDKLEPYAYWPLDRKMMSRRAEHRATARRGMASVVKLTKKLQGKTVSNALSVKELAFKTKKRKPT